MIIKEKDLASGKTDDFKNKLICGETLDALKKMPDNSVSLIITSPSYFLGKSYEKDHVFNEYLDEHKIILKECKRVLKETGSIFLHCDRNAVHNLKVICDEIFGESNFRSEIIWII